MRHEQERPVRFGSSAVLQKDRSGAILPYRSTDKPQSRIGGPMPACVPVHYNPSRFALPIARGDYLIRTPITNSGKTTPSQPREATMSTEAPLQSRTSNDLAAGYLLLMLSEEPKMREQESSHVERLYISSRAPSISTVVPPCCHTGPLHQQPRMVEEDGENQFLYRGIRGILPFQQHVGAQSKTFPSSITMSAIESRTTGSLPFVSVDNSEKGFLPKWFLESTSTVVIGKGHLPRKTAGNILLRQMVQDRLRDYEERNRRGRAIIVLDIYHRLRCLNPEGRSFGNFDPMGNWVEAQEHSAREKIAATFRDCLGHLYKSSTQNKVAKRRTRNAEK